MHLYASRIAVASADPLRSPEHTNEGCPMRRLLLLSLILAPLPAAPLLAASAPPPANGVFQNSREIAGLLDVHADAAGGRILLTLPPAGEDGISGRFLYTPSLR